jgi:hypothetical protein
MRRPLRLRRIPTEQDHSIAQRIVPGAITIRVVRFERHSMVSASTGRVIGAISGVVFFILIMVASGMLPSDPGPDDAAAKILKAYGNADGAILGVFLNSIAAVPLLWFAATLRDFLARREGGSARVSSLVLAGGAGGAVCGVLSGIVHGAVWSRIDQAGDVNADAVALLYVLAGSILSGFFVFSGIMALATFVVTVRHGGLPTWAGWLSGLLGLMMLAGSYDVTLAEGAGLLGLLGMALFFVLISLVLVMRVRGDAEAPAAS